MSYLGQCDVLQRHQQLGRALAETRMKLFTSFPPSNTNSVKKKHNALGFPCMDPTKNVTKATD